MSDFIIRVLKWLAALVTAYFILFVVVFLLLVGIGIALQPTPETMEKGSILVLDLGINLTDQPSSNDPGAFIRDALAGELRETVSLRQLLNALDKAGTDNQVHGLYIKGNLLADGYGGSFPALNELRDAIARFAEEKPVWAFSKRDSLRDYYLKSVATEVICDPQSMVDFRGLRAERLYLGDAFKRLGIEVQVDSHGDYKTAAEAFQSGSMSPAEREQLQFLIDNLWESILSDIAASRGIDSGMLDSVADSNVFLRGQEIIENHMADSSMNEDEFMDKLADEVGYSSDGKEFKQYGLLDYYFNQNPIASVLDINGSGNKVAIIYAEGVILDGKGEPGMIGAETFNRRLRSVREDDSIKAVVLRVNSPGGSASAASRIVRELELLKAEKPLVVSMGAVAASGGYMLSVVGDHVFAQPTTITGSIGVISIIPNIEQLAEKLSVSFEAVQTNKFGGVFSLGRSKSDEEMMQIRAMGAQTYDEFMQMVSVGRDLSRSEVLKLAQGRVWSGSSAVELDLVDETGGLMDAVRRAADLAGIGDNYKLIERPRALTLEEQIQEMLSGSPSTQIRQQGGLPNLLQDMEEQWIRLKSFNDPRGQYVILPYTLRVY